MGLSKRGWILLGSILPVLGFFALFGWAVVKSGGTPGSLGINNEFGEVRIAQEPARAFSLELMDGSTLTLLDLRGKVVMINFWASWCPPCREEAPILAEVYHEYENEPVEFVGVDIWDREDDALQYINQYSVTYPNGVDDSGVIAIDYGVRGIPETFFISPNGVVLKKFVGPINAATLRAVLDESLASYDPGPTGSAY